MADFGDGNRPGNGGLGDALRRTLGQQLEAAIYGNTYSTADGDRIDPATVTVEDGRIVVAEKVTGYLPISEDLMESYDDVWNPKHWCQTHEEARQSIVNSADGVHDSISIQKAKIKRARKKLKKLRKRLDKANAALVDFDETYPMEE